MFHNNARNNTSKCADLHIRKDEIMTLSPSEVPVLCVRRKIAEQPQEIQELIKKGEQTIDDALTFPYSSVFGTDSDKSGLNAFHLEEKVDDTVRQLLKELYEAIGWSVGWKSRKTDGEETEPNVVILHPHIA